MKMFKPAAIIIFASLLVIAALACSSKSSTSATEISKVQKGNISVSILASGSLSTSNDSNLTFYSSGTVKSILTKVGDMVNKGDILAELETADLESSLAQANISVKQARLNLENAQEPTTNSSGTTVIAAPDPLNIEIKELALKNAKDNLVEAEKKLKQATITAPFTGLVTEVNAVEGDQVSGTTTIVRLIDPENFETTVYVNETQIYNIKVGTPATVKISALPKNSYTAKVDSISETATISSNVVNYKVTVKLDPVSAVTGVQVSTNTENTSTTPQKQQSMQKSQQAAATTTTANTRLKEGLTVTVSIIIDAKKNILLVPNKAITSSGGKYYVQVVTSSKDVYERRNIQVGTTDGTNTEVTSGLNENEQVAIVTTASAGTSTSTSSRSSQQSSSQQVQMMLNTGGSGGPPSR